jgi:subtilisin family serine protease
LPVLAVSLLQTVTAESQALSIRWGTDGANIEAAVAGSCTLLVSSPQDETLPNEWHLTWIASSEASTPLTVSGLSPNQEYADGCLLKPATSRVSHAARVDTMLYCSLAASRRSVARYLVSVAGDIRAKLRLLSADPRLTSNEVTINGGLSDAYPPLAIAAQGVRHPGAIRIRVSGSNLASVDRAVLVPEGAEHDSLEFTVENRGYDHVFLRRDASRSLSRGSLELHDAAGMTAALSFDPSTMLSAAAAAEDHFLICFLPGAALPPAGQTSGSVQEFSFSPPSLGNALSGAGVTQLDRVFPWFGPEDVETTNSLGEPVRLVDLSTVYVARLAQGQDGQGALQALGNQEGVAYAEPDPVVAASFPNDPLFPSQWGLDNIGQPICQRLSVSGFDIKAQGAWSRTLGNPNVSIAILDTGIDDTHVELGSNTVLDTSFVPFTGPQDDSSNRHGTAVAGIAAATIDNSQGVAGVAPLSTLHSIKVLDYNGDGFLYQIAQGVDWARTHGYPIINMSLSTPTHITFALPPESLRTIRNVCLTAYLSGALVVASAGNIHTYNQGGTKVEIPRDAFPVCFTRRVLGVGALTTVDPPGVRRWSDLELFPGFCGTYYDLCRGSNFWNPTYVNSERFVDLVAPGGRFIVTTGAGPSSYKDLSSCTSTSDPADGTTAFGGTSAAAPVASGAAALLRAAFGLPMSGDEIEHILKVTARRQGVPLTEFPPDARYGWGLVNADSAIRYISSPRVLTRGVLAGSALPVFDSSQVSVIFRNVTGLSDQGTPCKRYRLRGTINHRFYTATPDLWIRGSGSGGTNDTTVFDSFVVVPSGQVLSSSSMTASLETSVFRVPGYGWIPTTPANARIAWTAVGPTNVVGVGDPPRRNAFALRASPNPISASARIELDLPGRGLTTMSVIDLSGRVVARLQRGVLEEGPHVFRWNGRSVTGEVCPAGVYFVRAEQNGIGLTTKLILLQGRSR